MGSPTRNQRIAHLVCLRDPLARRHARLEHPDRGPARHDAWGICACSTAQRLRNNSVAMASLNTPRPTAASGDSEGGGRG